MMAHPIKIKNFIFFILLILINNAQSMEEELPSEAQKDFVVKAYTPSFESLKKLYEEEKDNININGLAQLRAHSLGMQPALTAAAASTSERIVKYLLENGANVNRLGQYGISALIAAIGLPKDQNEDENKILKIVTMLIDKNADVNLIVNPHGITVFKNGATALTLAINKDYKEIVKALLNAGADPALPNNQYNAFSLAQSNDEMLKLLQSKKNAPKKIEQEQAKQEEIKKAHKFEQELEQKARERQQQEKIKQLAQEQQERKQSAQQQREYLRQQEEKEREEEELFARDLRERQRQEQEREQRAYEKQQLQIIGQNAKEQLEKQQRELEKQPMLQETLKSLHDKLNQLQYALQRQRA